MDSEDETPLSVLAFARKAPILLFAVGMFAILDAANLSFLPVYAVKKGFDQETAALALTAFVVGNTVLQFPIGWCADHFPKRTVMAVCAVLAGAASFLVPFVFGTWMLWPVLTVMGATAAGIYTVALAELGERFSGHELVTGTASFSTMWGVRRSGRVVDGGLVHCGLRAGWPTLLHGGGVLRLHPVDRRQQRIGTPQASMTPRSFSYGAGVFFVAAGAACWSLGGALVRLTDGLDVWQIIFYRSLTVLLCMGIWLVLQFRGTLRQRMAAAGMNAVIAGVAVGTAGLSFVAALFYTTVAEAIFMVGIAPFLSALLGFWILRSAFRPSPGWR